MAANETPHQQPLQARPRLAVYSHRLDWDQPLNPLLQRLAAKRAAGDSILDLTQSNPTQVGFNYSQFDLPSTATTVYHPSPQGLPATRVAIADYYHQRGHPVDPNSLLVTASTSEAYSFLFKLLCDPGDEVLIPQPGYPLFDFLTALDLVQPIYYSLQYTDTQGWRINFERLQAALGPRTKALIVVNPHNPTGSVLTSTELYQLHQICIDRNLALIIDEVFADYQPLTPFSNSPISNSPLLPLTFTLNGLSKIVGLPQAKLGWVQVNGPLPVVRQSLARLEFISDTYLSVSTAIQLATPTLLAKRAHIQIQIQNRLNQNLAWLQQQAPNVLKYEGGWYAVLEFNDARSDDERAQHLLDTHNVFIHPGYFYDFARAGYVALSLLTPPMQFQAGVDRLLVDYKSVD